MAEFTGERVIPGQVDIDLFNEHMARYAFAARLARGKRVLDAGCGAGYGAAELAKHAASVVGIDSSEDAVEYARASYALPNLTFERASCESLPHPDASFDLIVAFEVIEHLKGWARFLREARRVLAPNGQFIVSTPNKLYYAESRGDQGANPFHVHEFEFEEFRNELRAVFPSVAMYLENHMEGVTFEPHEAGHTVEVRLESGVSAPEESHFFVGVCANRSQIGNPAFVYVPRAGNVLRERERHIDLLETELRQKNDWLETAKSELALLQEQHERQSAELDRSNQWAEEQNREVEARRARVADLQEELARDQQNARAVADGYAAKIRGLEADIREKTQWAVDLETSLKADVAKQTAELVRAVEALHRTEKELDERTAWARRLEAEAQGLHQQVALFEGSRWVRLGRKVGLGPKTGSAAFPAS